MPKDPKARSGKPTRLQYKSLRKGVQGEIERQDFIPQQRVKLIAHTTFQPPEMYGTFQP
jgi:hypothetical protein